MLEAGSIELSEANPYANGGRIIAFDDGQMALLREPLEWVPSNEDSYHVVHATDRLDLLAFKYYKKYTENPEKYWWVIADANEIENPMDLSDVLGQPIIIPNLLNVKLQLKQQ